VEDLLASFFEGLRNGSIPRFSENWTPRGLADKDDSV